MSGGLDEYIDQDTARSIETGRQTIGVALRTAQQRLQKVFIAFVVGLLGGIMAMRIVIWPKLKTDLLAKGARVIAQTPFDVILLQVKIGLVLGVLLAIPVLLFYARDPLAERDIIPDIHVARWKIGVIVVASILLALGGIVYAYFLFFPIMFTFLAGNALGAGLAPMYSIVHWTQFIFMLAISFALAAQLPLAMTALSYSGILPYEFFREKWRHAVVLIFVFGALFSPPDPFTQLMWAFPLLALYGFSLYLARVVTIAKRGSEQMDLLGVLRTRWNVVAGAAVLGGGAVYAFFSANGETAVNQQVVPSLPGFVNPGPMPLVQSAVGLPRPEAVAVVTVVVALVVAAATAMAVLYHAIVNSAAAAPRDPIERFDIDELSLKGVRAAPPELFERMSEEEAVEAARTAMKANDPDKAQTILDRFDDPEHEFQQEAEQTAEGEGSDPITSTTAGMVNAFTDGETTEDDIGGYYYDIRFIVDSLRSKAFRLMGIFMVTMAGLFAFLYQGGIGMLRADFLARIPADVRPTPAESQWPITLHPVEALVFEVKIATVLAAIVTVPFLFYYAYPALEERGILGGNRRYIALWGLSIGGGLVIGSVLGYVFVAPTIISYLVYDALRAGMVISYRVNNFFWMVFLTTAGIGLLADVPVSMLLFHRGGLVGYRTMRKQWRIAVLGFFVFGALVTPESLYTMLLIALPLTVAFFVGLGILWVLTLGGRRGGGKPEAVEPAAS